MQGYEFQYGPQLIAGSAALYRRVARLDEAQAGESAAPSPVRSLQDRLALAF